MAFDANMADAVSGQPASAAEYNKVKNNVLDLNTRVGTTASPSALGPRADALEAAVTTLSSGRYAFFLNTGDQTLTPDVETLVVYPTTSGRITSPLVSVNANSDTFTLLKAGVWTVTIAHRNNGYSGGSSTTLVERFFRLTNGGTGAPNAYQNWNTYIPQTAAWLTGAVVRRFFAANTKLSVTALHRNGANSVLQGSAGTGVVGIGFTWESAS